MQTLTAGCMAGRHERRCAPHGAGVASKRYLDSEEPETMSLGLPPALDGSCESGDLKISISVFERNAGSLLDGMIPNAGGMYRDFGIDEVVFVADGTVTYAAEPLDGSPQAVPSESVRELLTRIAQATGGELKNYKF
jgi:hypothetical protein